MGDEHEYRRNLQHAWEDEASRTPPDTPPDTAKATLTDIHFTKDGTYLTYRLEDPGQPIGARTRIIPTTGRDA